MYSIIRFHRGLLRMPLPLQLWVALLVAANLVTPLFFFEHAEARITLAAGVAGLVLMSALTGRFGFSRIVGIGHLAWFPLLAYLVGSLGEAPATTGFGVWLRAVIALDTISLGFDLVDAVRFVRGDRGETVSGLGPLPGGSSDFGGGIDFRSPIMSGGEPVGIRRVVDHYLAGARSGKSEDMRPAFHPDATVFGYVADELFAGSIGQLFDWVEQNGPAKELEARIADIDVVESVATLRLELDNWTGKRFTDLFTLLELDGEWKIMNKVFHLHTGSRS